jgi:hypothetical protein
LGVKGLCNNETIQLTYPQFVFDDLNPPSASQIPPSNRDPCADLPSDIRDSFIQEARNACARVIDQSMCCVPSFNH